MATLSQISAMRLVRQVSLYFREGNSDKLYEIDFCSVGEEAYVVNFRYGRRGAPLKEGTKTSDPVSLYKAEEIFQSLEAEKRSKGYKSLTETNGPELVPLSVSSPNPQINFEEIPPGRKKAILQRLQDAVNAKAAHRFPWKTSRVIWMAGVMRMEEAVDAILFLAMKGDAMQQYAAVWALGRCGAQKAIPLFLSQFKSGSAAVQRISGAALLRAAEGAEKEKQWQFYLHSLPEPFQAAIRNNDGAALMALLQERVLGQSQPHYNLLEDLYLLSQTYHWIKPGFKELLLHLPLKPGYFKHLRHIFKLAEFLDDFEIVGLLAHRFEKERELFRASTNADNEEDRKLYIPALNEYVSPKKELAKKTSRLAYSDKTKQYLIRRTLRLLRNYGEYEDGSYVRLATALLLTYEKEKDHTAPYSTYNYVWQSGNYTRIENRFPANAAAVYLNEILYGASPGYKLLPKNVWITVDPNEKKAQSNTKGANEGQGSNDGKEGIVGKIISFFTGKKSDAVSEKPLSETAPEGPAEEKVTAPVENKAPHLLLWDRLPEAYVQLLMKARMDEVHHFAMTRLQRHPDYSFLKTKLDATAIQDLLLSEFTIPAEFAFDLAQERYNPASPDSELVKAMLYGRLEKAQQKAMEWVEAAKDTFLSDTAFVAALLLCPNAACRTWINGLISDHPYSDEAAQAIVARTITHILSSKENTPEANESIEQAGTILVRRFAGALAGLPLQVVEHLVQAKTPSVQMLGIDILLLQKARFNFDQLSNDVFSSAIYNAYTPLRVKGMELLSALSTPELLKRQELVIQCCLSGYPDVRKLVRPVVGRMAENEPSFGVQAAEWLLPYLLRKESHEGLHRDVADTLRHELSPYLKEVNRELVLRLLYSAFVPVQEYGITLLQTAIDPQALTLRQIIALGNHETKSVREWVWHYFENNIARIRYEREDAIRLLDAAWDDTREFAKVFFKVSFQEADWSPEVLVGLADSVRPDIEAYGRELITRFFKEEHGEEYLLKLSQHPGEKMQLFATNYLERFAANDIARLQSLEFYFRSVLTRVNKARIAKNRIFRFLGDEGKKSEAAAQFVAGLISQVAATVSIEDKAKCIDLLLALQSMYDVQTPVHKIPVEERM